MEARDQSTLNRFLTASSWSLQRLEAQRLALARENLSIQEGSTGYLIARASQEQVTVIMSPFLRRSQW